MTNLILKLRVIYILLKSYIKINKFSFIFIFGTNIYFGTMYFKFCVAAKKTILFLTLWVDEKRNRLSCNLNFFKYVNDYLDASSLKSRQIHSHFKIMFFSHCFFIVIVIKALDSLFYEKFYFLKGFSSCWISKSMIHMNHFETLMRIFHYPSNFASFIYRRS